MDIRTFRGLFGFYSPGRPELYKLHKRTPKPRLTTGKEFFEDEENPGIWYCGPCWGEDEEER